MVVRYKVAFLAVYIPAKLILSQTYRLKSNYTIISGRIITHNEALIGKIIIGMHIAALLSLGGAL